MSPIGHLAIGFAAKRAGVTIPLGVLLAAAWLLDILYFVFGYAGIDPLMAFDKPGSAVTPWSHGLLMALVWTAAAALLAGRVYRSRRAGAVIGLVVFSHWLLDFISWDNLALFFKGSPEVGMGLFKSMGSSFTLIELGLFAAGIAIYLAGIFPGLKAAGQKKRGHIAE